MAHAPEQSSRNTPEPLRHSRDGFASPALLLLQPPPGQWKITLRCCIVCLQSSRAKHNTNSLCCEVQRGTGAAHSQRVLLLVCDSAAQGFLYFRVVGPAAATAMPGRGASGSC